MFLSGGYEVECTRINKWKSEYSHENCKHVTPIFINHKLLAG